MEDWRRELTGILKGDIIIRKSFFKTKDLAAARGNRPEPGVRRGTDQEEAPAGTAGSRLESYRKEGPPEPPRRPPAEAAQPSESFCRSFFQKAGGRRSRMKVFAEAFFKKPEGGEAE